MRWLSGAVLAAAMMACSPAGETAPSDGGVGEASAFAERGDACHGALTSADAAPVLGAGEISLEPMPDWPDTCVFTGANGAALQVALVRGAEVPATWDLTAQLGADGRLRPVESGVGEASLRTADGAVFLTRQGELLCQIDVVSALETVLAQPGVRDAAGLTAALAGLCAKVFEAERM